MTAHRVAHERGAMAVEFGVMFPLVALLIAGSIFFGTAFSAQLSLTQAAREAVRTYALTGSAAQAETTANAAYGGPGAITVQQGIAQVDGVLSGVCDPLSPGSPPANAGVRVSTTFVFDIAFMPFPSLDLDAQAVMRCGG
jgi:Flp pilus assembly pilin Flp